MGWPKISMKDVCNIVSDIAENGRAAINNTLDDAEFFFKEIGDCVGGCGANLDQIRLRGIHRSIEYTTGAIELLSKYGVIPTEWIYYLYNLIAEDIRRDPNPEIYYFENPYEAIHLGMERAKLIRVNPTTFVPRPGRESWVFIHGMLYKAVKRDGSDFSYSVSEQLTPFSFDNSANVLDFFYTFEESVGIIKKQGNIDIYLVSYNSEANKDEKRIIENLIRAEAVSIDIGSSMFLIFAAVFWYEMERRAKITGNYIIPFLSKLRESGNDGKAITHSLGCYVLAHAGQKMNNRDTRFPSFREWWCMSAALPSNAFTSTGDFNRAYHIADRYSSEGNRTGTYVMYSIIDVVLTLLYPVANYHTALGQSGAGITEWVHDLNITNITKGYHEWAGDYMNNLSPLLRHLVSDEKYIPNITCCLNPWEQRMTKNYRRL